MPRLPVAQPAAPKAPAAEPARTAEAEVGTQPFQATPNPAMKLDPRLGLVVLQFRDEQGEVTATLPTERELAAYRNAGKRAEGGGSAAAAGAPEGGAALSGAARPGIASSGGAATAAASGVPSGAVGQAHGGGLPGSPAGSRPAAVFSPGRSGGEAQPASRAL
ncbi:hypothetical protein JYK14_12595 [Siccirubricoccus sp. KC 17139]|uniref:Flagellar hook-length control protein FliK n=2 Tax=Siccirubricoccus soli TaxID=2899147 RepID=A0ABT1D4Y4_9PROT|nr:hypothetical protein [Siccirubricoccus soli]MCP2683128.1 hypothetical protein [Siccirubricoccus soli]